MIGEKEADMISKADAREMYETETELQVRNLETEIDAMIKRYNGAGSESTFNVGIGGMSDDIVGRVIAKYTEGGWTAERTVDADGDPTLRLS